MILFGFAACDTYVNHRTAVVPHASPVVWDGQTPTTTGQISIGADNLVDAIKPTAGDPTQGDQIPQQQFRGMLSGRISDRLSVSAIYEKALTSNTTLLSSTSPRITDTSLTGFGGALKVAIPTDVPGLRIGIAGELVLWDIPWAEFSTCSSFEGQGCGTVTSDRSDIVPTLGLAVIPSYRNGRMTYFGGITLRNQPTITEVTVTNGSPDPSGPNTGGATFTLHAGAGVDLGYGVHANAFVHQTLAGPINYGPSLGFELAIPLGDQHPQPNG